MKVRYIHGVKGKYYSNIIWCGAYPMYHGKFPENHPLSDTKKPMGMIGDQRKIIQDEIPKSTDKLGTFRSRGYEASCFREGFGIVINPQKEQTAQEVIKDIEECFGWEVHHKE